MFDCPVRAFDCPIEYLTALLDYMTAPLKYLTALLEYMTALLEYLTALLEYLTDYMTALLEYLTALLDYMTALLEYLTTLTRVYQKISPFKIRVDGALAPATPSCYASVCLLVKIHIKGKDQHTLINSQLPECSIRVSDCSIKMQYIPTLVYLKPEMTALLEYFEYRCMLY